MFILNLLFIALIYMIEPYLWMKSMSVMKHKFEGKMFYFAAFFGYYVLTLLKQFVSFFGKSDLLTTAFEVILILYLFFVPYLLFEEPMYRKIINVGIFLCCIFATEAVSVVGFILLFGLSMRDVQNFGWLNSFCTLLAKIFLYIMCYFFFFHEKKRMINRLYGNQEIILLVTINFLLEMPMLSIFQSTKLQGSSMMYFIFVFIQFVLIGNMIIITWILRKQKHKMTDLEEELSKSKQIIELSAKLSDLKHDISFHANIMKNLADEKKYEELADYIERAFSYIEEAKMVFTLSDRALSATLNILAKKAEEKNIDFKHIILVEDFIIPSPDICSLIFNMVANAIEAVGQLEEKQRIISLEIAPDEGGYYINCINPLKEEPKIEHGVIATSKEDSVNHGRGIRIIKKIAEKNNGIAKISIHDTCFEFYCFIPDKEQ